MTPIYTGEIVFDSPVKLVIDNVIQVAEAIDKITDQYDYIDQSTLDVILEQLNIPYVALTLVDADTDQVVDEMTELFHIGVTLAENYPFSLEVH